MPNFTNAITGRGRKPNGGGGNLPPDVGFEHKRIMGDFIAQRRTALGLTQVELGRALGVSGNVISAVELGRNGPAPDHYIDYADALKLNRKTWGKFLLQHTNPWIFHLMFPGEMPEQALDRIPPRTRDWRKEPNPNGNDDDAGLH